MAVFVNTNYSALQGQRYLGNVQNQLTTTYQRLSSGMRINSAKDDAAGLQIADRLTSQINGLNQGNRNASDGIALAQTMEAGMDEISGMLQKIRTLTVQAANGTNTMEDRKALGKEMESLANEVNRIAMQTTYGGKKILNGKSKDESSLFGKDDQNGADKGKGGSVGTMTLQVGSNKGDTISFTAQSFMFSTIGGAANNNNLVKAGTDTVFGTDANTGKITVTMSKLDFSDATKNTYVGKVIELMDSMIGAVDAARADLGAIQNHESLRKQPLKSLKVA